MAVNKINADDTLNQGRLKINNIVDDLEKVISSKNNIENLNFFAASTNYESAASSADDNLYIFGNTVKAGFIKKIIIKTNGAVNGELYIFKSKSEISNGFNKIVLIEKLPISGGGDNQNQVEVTLNQNFGYDIIIGFKGRGFAYSKSGTRTMCFVPSDTASNYYIGQQIDANFINSDINFAYSIEYGLAFGDDRINNVTSFLQLLDTSIPSYDREYPIVFDFVKNILTIKGFALSKNTNAFSSNFSNVNVEIDLPELNKQIKDYQNYSLTYNGSEFILRHSVGGIIMLNDFKNYEDKVCDISIKFTDSKKPFVHFTTSQNRNLVKVIVNQVTSENNNDQLDIVTSKIIDGGVYHYTYGALGDSITRGENPENTYKPMLNDRYTDIVSRETGMIVNNFGIGGTCIARTSDGLGMVDRVNNMGNADIYSVFGGTNDFARNIEIGQRPENDLTHFAPAFEEIIRIFASTGKKFFVITPLKRSNMMTANQKGYILDDYVRVEREIAEEYGVPILDLNKEFVFTAYKSEILKNKYMPDGLHPNTNGMKLLGEIVTNFIKRQFL